MNHKLKKYRISLIGFIFLTPGLLFILNAYVIPFFWNLILSFQEWDGFGDKKWIEFANYKTLIHDSVYWDTLNHSIYIALGATIIGVLAGLFLAILIFKVSRKEGSFFRLVFFMPVMLPLAIIGLMFTFVYNPEMGMLNQLLKILGLGNLQEAWLSNPDTVLAAITFVGVWRVFGITMILCFAGIQSIPTTLLEASRMDGAGYTRQIFSIILPLIKPIIQLSAIYTLAGNFKTFDLVYVMTKGGPGIASQIVPIYLLKTGFSFNEFGYAAAMGCILTAVVILFTLITRLSLGGKTYEY
jgi:raffinose/stachyose/melibiose transport system permease protein